MTTVAPQSLILFNGELTEHQAQHFAVRLKHDAGDDLDRQITLAWRIALCREPTPAERTKAKHFLQNESLEQLCRVILNLNEFVYPD